MITMNCAEEYVVPSDYLWLMKITQKLTFSLVQRKNILRVLRLFVADFSSNIKPIELMFCSPYYSLANYCNRLYGNCLMTNLLGKRFLTKTVSNNLVLQINLQVV